MTGRKTLDDMTSDELDQLYDALDRARVARRRVTSALIAVESLLTTPYPDDPRWTPWTRFVQPALKELREALPPDPAARRDTAMTDLTLQQTDALWDAVAIPGPEQPTFVKQHERACKAVAEMLHLATAPREAEPLDDGDAGPGYCPHCGRGDCAPTADEYEQQRQRAERVRKAAAQWRIAASEGDLGLAWGEAATAVLALLDNPNVTYADLGFNQPAITGHAHCEPDPAATEAPERRETP
ncbi:hypothetical protein [Streptomyces sp. NPDC060001]|uniref:hypothetical protein n=1 Tax=Streptomyces sp. NPDC060001 TaxID=3347032 RepID=UPI00368944AC